MCVCWFMLLRCLFVCDRPTPFKSLFYNSHESRTAFIGFAHPQGGEILKLAIRPTTPVNVFKGCFLCA